MSINIATFYTCPGKSAKVPDNLTQCPGIGLKNYGMYARGHIYCPIFMKLVQKIHPDNILDEFKNDAGWLKNMAARGRGIFPYMAIVKPC
jgi:hypothetical protein